MKVTRAAAALLGWALTVSSAGAYYHFIHYTSKSAPYQPVPEKFDLAALPSKTVTFFVSASGPTQFAQYDGLPSLLSQIRQATLAWDGVATSDLRVAFGGLYADGTPENTPSAELVFDEEIPPGLLAYTVPMPAKDMVTRQDGSFFPITQSIIHFHSDLTQRPGPSYTDAFYLTVVHEMGHALGLQHTFTSSVMSTAVTRATSALRPLDADDIAAISLLYPRNFGSTTGTITGTVNAAGRGVHMASVVALRTNGSAVSALTNPDGTYRIDGVPPGTYFIYVQALPPTANIIPPKDPDGNDVNPSGPFAGVFYPNTTDIRQATPIAVRAAAVTGSINFSVNMIGSLPVYDVSTYSYFGQSAVHPAYINMVPGAATIAAAGVGLGTNGQVAPGLGLSILGSSFLAQSGLRGYGSTPTYLAIDLQFTLGATTGPQHFIFSQGSDLYVLPSALNLVTSDPPSIASVTTDGSGTVTVTGSNFGPDSEVYFDGLPAVTKVVDASHATVVPPPGANQQATVTVYNSDGQSSMFLGPSPVPTYSYRTAAGPNVTLSPSILPAGARAMIDVSGANMNFVDGLTTVGLGSSDILVRRVWVLSPTHALINVQVAPDAQPGATMASVISGFQVFSKPSGFQTLAFDPNLPIIEPTLLNGIWLPSGVFPGSIASLYGLNLGAPQQTTITINDQPVSILYTSPVQINLVIPASLKPGPAILKLNNGAVNAYPVVIEIDPTPPVITAVQNASNLSVNSANAPLPGDTLSVLLTGFADPGATVASSRVHATVGGVDLPVSVIKQVSDTTYQVQFKLNPSVPAGSQVPLTVTIDGRTSMPVYIPINPPPASSTGN
jgi:uncharacterized protein (TIGR03437 family)